MRADAKLDKAAERQFQRVAPGDRARLTAAAGLALALHTVLLFGWRHPFFTPANFAAANRDQTVDVNIIDAPATVAPAQQRGTFAEPVQSETPPPPLEQAPPPQAELVLAPSPVPGIDTASRAKPVPTRAASAPLHTGGISVRAGPRTNIRTKPGYLQNPPPDYPLFSRQNHEEGVVLLEVSVDEKGGVGSLRLLRSSGYPRLDDAAEEAVRRWRFNPGRAGGIAVSTEIEIPVRFRVQ